MARAWGVWTRSKLELLEKYLDRFTTASKKVSERVYLDLFGGQPENVDRLTRDPIDGSARIALDTSDPPFSRLRFFELPAPAAKLKMALAQQYPGRDFVVYSGDCNETIHQALADLHQANIAWAPTFAFIDPNGPHCHWSTIEALARHKKPFATTKVELWMLFPVPLFQRMLPRSGVVRRDDSEAISLMYGTDDWHAILEAKLEGEISATEARAEYLNLMRWRLETDLDYQWTHHLLVRNEANRPIYYMVFATDSEPGKKIMRYLYEEASVTFPAMIQEHRAIRERMEREAAGIRDLFSEANIDVPFARPSGRIALPDEPPEQPRDHDAENCRFCASDAPWEDTDIPKAEEWFDEDF